MASQDYKILYFNARGRAEIPRTILAVAGKEFEDARFEGREWGQLKQTTPFGQVPTLEFGGKKYCQSFAISRYLAKKHGLAGETLEDDLEIDMATECMEDMGKNIGPIYFMPNPEKKAEAFKKFAEEQLPTYMKNLEGLLNRNNGGDGWWIGDKMTWADIAWHFYYSRFGLINLEPDMTPYPKLEALRKRVEAEPRVAAWLERRPKTDF